MSDFVIDIKTRLIKQAAELGISTETAALLAACVDATAKDYAGDRVYIGRPADVQIAMSRRDRAIIHDWRAGERVALISRRYGISTRRIRQIVAGSALT